MFNSFIFLSKVKTSLLTEDTFAKGSNIVVTNLDKPFSLSLSTSLHLQSWDNHMSYFTDKMAVRITTQ